LEPDSNGGLTEQQNGDTGKAQILFFLLRPVFFGAKRFHD
jgi:hypothetical protein